MPVLYNNNKIIPAPLVNIQRQIQKTGDGTPIGIQYDIVVQGKLIAWKGSPDSSGNFWNVGGYPPDENVSTEQRLKSILNKQEALKRIFCDEGKWFEIQPIDGSSPLKCKPRTISVEFPQGTWHDTCDYTIQLQTDELYINGTVTCDTDYSAKISSADESWTIEFNDVANNPIVTNTFRITHNINAIGKRFYDNSLTLTKPAWQQARDWVQPRLGIDNAVVASPGALNIPSYYGGYNHVRLESIDELAGTYGISESWIMSSGNVLEELNIESNTTITDGLTRVSLNGTIVGLESRDSNYQLSQRKYDAANIYWQNVASAAALGRAQNYAGISLNITPNNTRIGRNVTAGVITYSYEYDSRPNNCIAGALSENINIIDNNPTDVFASIGVLGRTKGPVLQAINTITSKQRQLNVEAIMPTQGTCATYITVFNNKPDISTLITAATGGLTFTQLFVDQDQENWNPKTGQYSRTISWTYQ